MGLLQQRGEYLLYLRKSRSDSPDASVEEVLAKHEKMLQDYFRRELGYEIPEENIYREIISGGESIEERPEMCKVLSRIEDENVLGVACADPQRLSRGSLTDCDLLIDSLRYSKTLCITPVMVYDLENKMHRRLFQDELMRGRDYLDYVKTVLYTGRCQSALKGNFIASQPPYGYNKVKVGKDWTLEPNDDANIVRMIFNWYVKDYKTPGQISDELTKMLIPPSRGKRWTRDTVLVFLKNHHYDGKIVFGRKRKTVVFENGKKVTKTIRQKEEDMIIVEGKHPAIIDHDIFELAQERVAGRSYLAPRTKKKITNPYVGLLKCSCCGNAMSYKKTENYEVFNCKLYCHKGPKIEEIQKAVINALQMEHLPELEAKVKNGDGDSLVIQKQILEKLEKQFADFKTQELKQYELLETGMYTNAVFIERNTALKEKMKLCSEQIAETRASLPKAVDYEEKIITLKEAIAALDDETIPVDKKNRLLKAIIKRMDYSSPHGQGLGINLFTLSITLNI